MEKISRRDLVKKALVSVGGLFAASKALADSCVPTNPQMEGPYYPESDLNRDNNLTNFGPGTSMAKGQIILLRGVVRDDACVAVRDAVVEIWQAAASGKYNHSEDSNNLSLDPAFQYWGRTRTNLSGEYLFKTIIPGHYPLGNGDYRPPHIHVKVHAAGHQSFTTQVYFDPRSYDDPKAAALVEKLNRLESVDPSLMVLYERISVDTKEGYFAFTLSSH